MICYDIIYMWLLGFFCFFSVVWLVCLYVVLIGDVIIWKWYDKMVLFMIEFCLLNWVVLKRVVCRVMVLWVFFIWSWCILLWFWFFWRWCVLWVYWVVVDVLWFGFFDCWWWYVCCRLIVLMIFVICVWKCCWWMSLWCLLFCWRC